MRRGHEIAPDERRQAAAGNTLHRRGVIIADPDAGDGRIVNIAERTVPLSLTAVYSEGPVRAVLELNGGTSARLGIRPGDRVIHPIFDGAN